VPINAPDNSPITGDRCNLYVTSSSRYDMKINNINTIDECSTSVCYSIVIIRDGCTRFPHLAKFSTPKQISCTSYLYRTCQYSAGRYLLIPVDIILLSIMYLSIYYMNIIIYKNGRLSICLFVDSKTTGTFSINVI